MAIDEEFLEEMLNDISNYHINNGCQKEMGYLIGLLNVYKILDLNQKRNIEKSVQIRSKIYNVIKKYRNYPKETIHGLYRELENQIILMDDKRKEKSKLSLKILFENGEIVFFIDFSNIK